MKMAIAIVQDKDAGKLLQRLTREGISATRLSSSGGFLRAGNTTLLIGIEEDQLDPLVEIIKQTCRRREEIVPQIHHATIGPADTNIPFPLQVPVGGATVFILSVDRMFKV